MQRGISGLRDSQVLHGKNLGLSLGLADPLLWWFREERICLQCRRPGLEPWVGKIPLEEGMATHSTQSQRVGYDWAMNISQWDKILGRYPYWLVWFEGGSGEISGRGRSARWWHSLAKPSGPSRGSSWGAMLLPRPGSPRSGPQQGDQLILFAQDGPSFWTDSPCARTFWVLGAAGRVVSTPQAEKCLDADPSQELEAKSCLSRGAIPLMFLPLYLVQIHLARVLCKKQQSISTMFHHHLSQVKRSLAGCSQWGGIELDTTERLSLAQGNARIELLVGKIFISWLRTIWAA